MLARITLLALIAGIALLVCRPCTAAPGDGPAPDERVDFHRDIRPLLAERCYRCHGPDAAHRKADLRLDTEQGAIADLGGRRSVVPGDPANSELLSRVTADEETLRMPPPSAGEPLSPREIRLLTRWIEEGARYAPHWLFAPLERPVVPRVGDPAWNRNPIDAFILNQLKGVGLRASPPADARTVIRRISQDLLGLPAEASPLIEHDRELDDADWQHLVDRLLADPAYGERMAITWLDLVRYADTVGYHGDQEHHISPYRDYVISAFNRNLPFDQFTREQLAGDLLENPTLEQRIASGYNRLLQTSHEGGVQKGEYQKKYDADRVRNFGSVWLGMTMACAECHDHKFDPISQSDFYSLVAFFADVDDTRTFNGGDTNPTRREPEIEVFSADDRLLLDRLTAAGAGGGDSGTAGEPTVEQRAAIDSVRRRARRTMITDRIPPRTIRVLARGNWQDETGAVVTPATPAALAPLPDNGLRPTRLDLANWLTCEARAQTARVFVNRLWAQFFGKGLSRTLDDSGVRGDWPSHLELLDWLAAEFIESGWDIKHLVRLIVTSATYRQSSRVSDEHQQRDPENRLLARQGRWRLPAEGVRDQALAVSGLLVRELGGRSVRPWQPEGYYVQLNFPRRDYRPDHDSGQYRRGVYVHWQRQYLHPMLRAFDAPMREECTADRAVSNTPQAALVLLNDPTFLEAARGLALRILQEGGTTDEERFAFAWNRLLSRAPKPHETETLRDYLAQCRTEFRDDALAGELLSAGMLPVPQGTPVPELAAWTAVSRLLLNLNETLMRE